MCSRWELRQDTDLVVSHGVLEVGVEAGGELQQPRPLGLQRAHVGLHDAGGRVPVQDHGAAFLLHGVEVTLSRLQLANEALEANQQQRDGQAIFINVFNVNVMLKRKGKKRLKVVAS